MLPTLIEYLLAATALQGRLAQQATTGFYATILPGQDSMTTLGPPGIAFASIAYNVNFSVAPANALHLNLHQAGVLVYSGNLGAKTLDIGISCYLALTQAMPISFRFTNRDPLITHSVAVRVDQLTTQTPEQWAILESIVGRMNTDTSDTQLLSDILSVLKMGLNVGGNEVPQTATPIAPDSSVVRRRSGHGVFWKATGKGLFIS